MNVSLTPVLEGMVKSLVKDGRYNSASEVVRDSLRLLHEREQVRELMLLDLKAAIQEGRDSGESTPFSADDIIAAGRERSRSQKR